jgi:hypothetical protein
MRLSPAQFEMRFVVPYGCRKVRNLDAGFELWITGWGMLFTLRPLSPGGHYDQHDCNQLVLRITGTMPLEWRTASEVSKLREAIEQLTEEIRKLRSEIRGSRSGGDVA